MVTLRNDIPRKKKHGMAGYEGGETFKVHYYVVVDIPRFVSIYKTDRKTTVLFSEFCWQLEMSSVRNPPGNLNENHGIPMIFQQKKLVKDVYDRMTSRISPHNKGFNT